MPETYVYSNGQWRKQKQVLVRHQGQVRDCKEVWVKSGGAWRLVFSKNFMLEDLNVSGYNYNVYNTAMATGQWDGVTPVQANIVVTGNLGSIVSPTPDWAGYIAANPDLQSFANSFFKGPVAYAKFHYYTFGQTEGRALPMVASPPAFASGPLPSGSSITLTVNEGVVLSGAGGLGGEGGVFNVRGNHVAYTPSTGGFPGGDAINTSVPITIINKGIIGGGGGGGAGGAGAGGSEAYDDPGGAGGGGAGNIVGTPGASVRNGTFLGQPGTALTGGAGGTISNQGSSQWAGARNGGYGGDLGMPGLASAATTAGERGTLAGFPGGQPGKAVVGISNVTWQVYGTVKGPTA